MLFWLLLIGLFVVPIILASIAEGVFKMKEDNTGSLIIGPTVVVWLVGGIIWFFAAASWAVKDPDLKHIDSERTYILAENSATVYDRGTLEFTYTENGQVKPFREKVNGFAVPFEKPKGFKITEYHIDGGLVSTWDLASGTTVEVIK